MWMPSSKLTWYVIDSVLPGTHPFGFPEPSLPFPITPPFPISILSFCSYLLQDQKQEHCCPLCEGRESHTKHNIPWFPTISPGALQEHWGSTVGQLSLNCSDFPPSPSINLTRKQRVYMKKIHSKFPPKQPKEIIKEVAGRPHKYSGSCLWRII